MKKHKLLYALLITTATLMLLVSCPIDFFIDTSAATNTQCRAIGISTRTYKLTINNLWTSTNFDGRVPIAFVSNAHFSPFVVLVHRSDFNIFKSGTQASSELEKLAEEGTREIVSHVYDNHKGDVGCATEGQGMKGAVTQILEVPVNVTYNTITILSMIAPSSDWFVAARIETSDPDVFTSALPSFLSWMHPDKAFKEGTAKFKNYDAGTEQDTTAFSIDNAPEPYQKDIAELTTPFNSNDTLVEVKYELK